MTTTRTNHEVKEIHQVLVASVAEMVDGADDDCRIWLMAMAVRSPGACAEMIRRWCAGREDPPVALEAMVERLRECLRRIAWRRSLN